MSYELTRKPIGHKIHFNSVTHPKFKHNRVPVNFIMPLSRQTASDNAAVPFILRKGCREYPDFSSLNTRLDNLYGARMEADVSKFGGYQMLEVAIEGLDNRFALEGEDVAVRCAELLASVVLDPKLEDGLLDRRYVELEKQFIIDTIEAEINEKRGYAVSQCVQIMCEGEPVAVRRFGYRETAEKITPQSATDAYHSMLKTAPIEIFFTGSGDPAATEKIFADRLAALERDSFDYETVRLRTVADTVKEKTERMELSQSKMVLGMRTGTIGSKEQVNAARVFSALFGGTPFSKLFLNVREKLSLCYYCASRFDVSNKLLLVDSGVEAPNKQKALDEILRQLKAVQEGAIDGEELKNTKLLINNTTLAVTDSQAGLEDWYIFQLLRGQSVSPLADTKDIDAVTREQVIEAARGVTLDTVYFLTGNEKEDN